MKKINTDPKNLEKGAPPTQKNPKIVKNRKYQSEQYFSAKG